MIKRMSLLVSSYNNDPDSVRQDLARQDQEESALNTLLNESYIIIAQTEVEQRHVGKYILLVLWKKDE